METRKLQVYVTEQQYQLLRQRAGKHGSIAGAVRELIDQAYLPGDPETDSFIQWVRAHRDASGDETTAEQAKRQLYEQSS